MRSTGFVVAAGGLAAANELLFSPANQAAPFNWRIIPATAVLALLLGGIEELAPDFAVGLSGLVLLSVLVLPTGQAGSLLENVTRTTAPKGS